MSYSALGRGLMRLAQIGGKFAGKYGPAASKVVGRVGVPAAVGTVVGGVRGGQQDGLGGVIPGAIGGGLTGGGLGMIPGVGGLNPYLQGGLGTLGGLYGPASMGVGQSAASRVGGAGLQTMQNQPNVSGQYIGQGGPVPNLGGIHGQMRQGPYGGTIWDAIDPNGLPAGIRFRSGLDTQQQISNQNRWFNAMFPQSEMKNKADFERELAAKQLGENIEMARKMQEGSLGSVLNIAEKNAQNMGQLLNTRQRYF